MGDELDELFGALDGSVEKVDSSVQDEPIQKKSRLENANENVATDAPASLGSSSYAVLMDHPAARSLHLHKSVSPPPKIEPKKASVDVSSSSTGDREIATGTSHDKSVRSYTALPPNWPPPGYNSSATTTPVEPAKTYSFELDPFQKQAIGYIDKEESVLVAAHTSAGKTAVAEYAVAKSLKAGQRVVYTSPIKALSNQKYRDLQEEFTDVGLMTGDITINPDATALVMTTEILRSMLYRGSEIMREVAWVIYDEVHYMRDSERGVVWEESIILLPHKVKYVFLSATIPNASQFADWIAEIHQQPCHVVYTNYRPTPLQHYVFPQGGDGLYLVVDEKGKFRENNFQKAMATLQSSSVDAAAAEAMLNSGNGKKRGRGASKTKKGGKGTFSDLHRIVKLIMERSLNPVIIFSFSKKDCERFALQLNQEDYTDDVEKDLISQVYINAIDSLSEDDRKLPQVEALLPLLKRGIGIHHGGLLPILKEIVEILFSEGLIKTLFATETFAIGINMPAKTVVFTNTRKWDGKDFRWVTSGEYIQMSGRAGRRGKDDRGIVIQMLDEKMEPAVCKDILYGAPDPLNSSYRISYNMLLNLMRVEDVDPEYLLRASFHQFQREKEAPGLIAQAESLEREAEEIHIGSPEEQELVAQYFQLEQQLLLTRQKITKILQSPQYILKFLQAGRLVDVTIGNDAYGWGVVLSYKKKTGTGSGGEAGRLASLSSIQEYSVDVILSCVDRHFDSEQSKGKDEDLENANLLWRGTNQTCRPATDADSRKLVSWRIFTVGLHNLQRMSAIKLVTPQDCTLPEARNKVGLLINTAIKRHGTSLLDPVNDLGIKDEAFQTFMKRAETLTQTLLTHKLATDYSEDDRKAKVIAFEQKQEKLERAKLFRDEARSYQTISMKEEMKKMKRVLKKLGHVDANGVIQTKGRTACEINTANELLVVELMFIGIFNDLSVEQCAALLSCLTYDEPRNDDGDPASGLKNFLSTPFYKLQEVARTVAKVEIACGIERNEEEFVDKFNPGM
jgi:ATP-dependent RNA helicase DOB1